MQYRIVKNIYDDNSIDYSIETNRLWGFIPTNKWRVIKLYGIKYFSTYEGACFALGIPLKKLVKKEIVRTE